MDVRLVPLVVGGFLKGYEEQVRKEKKEAKDIVDAINSDVLKALCTRYDNKIGEYPEHMHEGEAVLTFFEKLRADVKEDQTKHETK